MGSTWSSGTKRVISIARESSACWIASRSASSTITNSPFATSQPLTISSGPTSRSCTGHQRFCWIGVLHSRCSCRNDTSDARAFGDVARARPMGMLTRPKLSEPFQIVRICTSNCRGTRLFRLIAPGSSTTLCSMTQAAATVEPRDAVRQERTIGRLWLDAISQNRTSPAYLVERNGTGTEISWEDASRTVDELAHGLLSLGVRKGDAFAIVAQTTLEWALFDFALGLIGAIGAPIYANSSAKDTQFIVAHSEAVGVLCEDEEQRRKVEPLGLTHVFTFAGLDSLRERGRAHAREQPDAVREAASSVSEDDLFTYIYTSGTTGPPKACMIRHRNYYEMVAVVDRLEDLTVTSDLLLLYLPLAHNFGRLMHLTGPYVGYTIAFLPDPLRTAEALLQVRPTVLPSVPRVYEKVHGALLAKFDEESGIKRRIVDWALRVGYRVSALRQRGESIPPILESQRRLADRLVYGKVKDRLGGRLRIAISGGAPLSRDIAEFFDAL